MFETLSKYFLCFIEISYNELAYIPINYLLNKDCLYKVRYILLVRESIKNWEFLKKFFVKEKESDSPKDGYFEIGSTWQITWLF